ncbi:MAG: T9SS type A sorting domain-containing protein [Bacteroidia bacterium]|nr:T9SS type A sorting domain-containing protein [Bacteroidia bacterium]
MKKTLYVLLTLGVMRTFAQTVTPVVVAADGGFYSGSQGSVAWTIGEPVSETYSSGNITTMGFQQTELELATLLEEQQNGGNFLVYPNPVADLLNIDFSGINRDDYNLKVTDVLGKIVLTSKVNLSEEINFHQISLAQFAAGTYFLIISGNNFNKTVKINKTN